MYQNALEKSGHSFKLEYKKVDTKKKKRKRHRRVLWFNPPFNRCVKSIIGHQFLKLIAKHFPRGSVLYSAINRNTVKLSYSCTSNVRQIIQSHNQKVLSKPNAIKNTQPASCNCRVKEECPLSNKCLQQSCVYQATLPDGAQYIGSTEDSFKKRYTQHRSNFRNEKTKNATALSSYVWQKGLNPNPKIKWEILANPPVYRIGGRHCDLCLTEKLHISKKYNDNKCVNRRNDIALKCKHRARHRLSTVC